MPVDIWIWNTLATYRAGVRTDYCGSCPFPNTYRENEWDSHHREPWVAGHREAVRSEAVLANINRTLPLRTLEPKHRNKQPKHCIEQQITYVK